MAGCTGAVPVARHRNPPSAFDFHRGFLAVDRPVQLCPGRTRKLRFLLDPFPLARPLIGPGEVHVHTHEAVDVFPSEMLGLLHAYHRPFSPPDGSAPQPSLASADEHYVHAWPLIKHQGGKVILSLPRGSCTRMWGRNPILGSRSGNWVQNTRLSVVKVI